MPIDTTTTMLPQLPAWCFQPDADAPGLYLQCQTMEQRATIMKALGAPDPLPPIEPMELVL